MSIPFTPRAKLNSEKTDTEREKDVHSERKEEKSRKKNKKEKEKERKKEEKELPKHGSSEVERRIATPEIPGSNPAVSRSRENGF